MKLIQFECKTLIKVSQRKYFCLRPALLCFQCNFQIKAEHPTEMTNIVFDEVRCRLNVIVGDTSYADMRMRVFTFLVTVAVHLFEEDNDEDFGRFLVEYLYRVGY